MISARVSLTIELIYYSVELIYYKVEHSVLQTGAGITKRCNFITKWAGIRNWDKHCYKLWQLGVITKWVKS